MIFFRLILPLLLTGLAHGVSINWRSVQSPQPDLTVAIRVELREFRGLCVPSVNNVDEWLQNWNRVDGTDYNASDGFFASTVDYNGNLEGAVYMWLADYRGRWVLLTNPNWTWPDVSSPIAFPEDFFTSDSGTVAVVGSIGSDSSLSPQLVSAPAPRVIFEGWVEEQGLADSSGNADGDSLTDFEEFVFGTNPNIPNQPIELNILRAAEVFLTIDESIHPQIRLEVLDLSNQSRSFEQIDDQTFKILNPNLDRDFFKVRYSLKQ